jgi:hypothetical protein
MYVQVKKDRDQQWFPTKYKLTEDVMGQIMVDWDDKWNITPAEIGPSEKQNPQVQEIDDDEEEGDIQERGKGTEETTQHTSPCIDRKRKERETGRSIPLWTKHKVIKEVAIQALAEEYLGKIGDQVKEVTDNAFPRATPTRRDA